MSTFDERAQLASSRLHTTVRAVTPRQQTTMTTSRTKVLATGVVVLLVVAGVAAYLVGSSHGSTTSNLAPATPVPAGVVPRSFAPAGLGATMMVPSTWPDSPPQSGFQYVAGSATPPAGFVGAGSRGGVLPVKLAEVEAQRRTFLEGFGARISSATRGTVDNRPAVRLRYTLTANGQTVSDTEYDIIATSTLPVGAAQHQTTYNVITIVVGTPVSQPDVPLVDWVSSTIRVQP